MMHANEEYGQPNRLINHNSNDNDNNGYYNNNNYNNKSKNNFYSSGLELQHTLSRIRHLQLDYFQIYNPRHANIKHETTDSSVDILEQERRFHVESNYKRRKISKARANTYTLATWIDSNSCIRRSLLVTLNNSVIIAMTFPYNLNQRWTSAYLSLRIALLSHHRSIVQRHHNNNNNDGNDNSNNNDNNNNNNDLVQGDNTKLGIYNLKINQEKD
ncbi:hypothetical protein RFI_34530 [Reticulomyxa filosa]|uniref:Uncharacterized protein n=1 Tax=Reticulomyxa filosa TaxID=46433 RepID=X6LLV5_RETFI|nr:hypothetical protein RFI_34530 [Reticulomyxa filosa]|eukprot:ETO02883.1 hypothetical protein RFI_34530 [Reticulomyxa filosa]